MAKVKRLALAKARERRVALDRDRQARDGRVEQAAARVFLGVELREDAERAAYESNVGIGRALLELLAERIALEDVAKLCDLDTSEVRRLVRLPALAGSGAEVAQHDAPAGAVGEKAGRRITGPATVTQFRRRPLDADPDINVGGADAPVEVPVPLEGEAAGAARRAE